jgi:LacI family transcriptional regulator
MPANRGTGPERGSGRRRPTVTDVAREAGVSVATAGRVLGRYGNVSVEMKEQVQAAAERLGYAPNVVARSMRSGSTGSIGFLGADIANPFFASAMRGVCDVAREEGYEPILVNSDDGIEVERRAVNVLLARQPDGIIVSPTSVTDVEHLKLAQDQDVPVVLLDRHSAVLEADSVVVDNEAAAYGAVRHLLDLGHREIGLMVWTAPEEGPRLDRHPRTGLIQVRGAARPSIDRIRGYVAAMQDAGVVIREELLGYSAWTDSDGVGREADRLLTQKVRPTAIFAADNHATQSAFVAARRHRLVIPGDLSLVGFDDLDWTTLVDPPITVVAQSPMAMGRIAAEMLFARIKFGGGPPQRRVLPTELLVRGSTNPL